jgi:hypothetical protein
MVTKMSTTLGMKWARWGGREFRFYKIPVTQVSVELQVAASTAAQSNCKFSRPKRITF